tara:strand:+ start:3463 stop:4995 length:1533 start_codon:yes stop_codon:yes gene_type:complete
MKQDNLKRPKKIGVLLHPSSLPNSPVCGTFGSNARDWLRLLARNGIGVWQFLPLSSTDNLGSPYSSPSSFSFNPWFIDANDLVDEGFLPEDILNQLPGSKSVNDGYVDFDLANLRSQKIGKSLRSYWYKQSANRHAQFESWCAKQFWLEDHAYFMELRRRNNFLPWWDWSSQWSNYDSNKLLVLKNTSQDSLLEDLLIQWHLDRQWEVIKNLANELGILLFGDLPFYVSRDSADVWSNRSLFSILENGELYLQSGVPPDYFSDTGQLWGTPTYRWKKHKSSKYRWWRRRIERHLKQVELLRIDHFRALDSYWAVAGNENTAIDGFWASSPGLEMLNKFKRDTKGKLPLVSEDLGVITSEVEYLRDHFELPGMKILQFAFDGNPENPYLPENIKGNNWIVYTGTHDNATTSSWWENLNDENKSRILERYKNKENSPCWNLIEMGLETDAYLFVAPIQDLMCLDDQSRFNQPGTINKKNWSWRLKSYEESLNIGLRKYGEMAKVFDRSNIRI